MNPKKEWIKSLTIGLLAVAALLLWLATSPKPPVDSENKEAGAELFESLTDPAFVRSLTIVRRDANGREARIELARPTGDLWRIRTKENAPADDAQRLATVIAPLIHLKILERSLPPESGRDEATEKYHRHCQLIDPTRATAGDAADAAVALTVSGENDETFVRLLIGRRPEESSARRDIHYVRVPGRDTVYTVDFSAEAVETAGEDKAPPYLDRLSTDPLDWMNRDLLRISRWNIADFSLYDYAVEESGAIKPVRFFTAHQDPKLSIDRVWSYKRSVTFTDGKPTDESAEMNGKKINDSADALGHLRFNDLEKLPDPLPELFKANRPIQEFSEAKEQLAGYGIFIADHDPLVPESAEPVLASVGGELRLTMTDGVSYRLLFGAKNQNARYVLVRCSFDEHFFPAAANDSAAAERELNVTEGRKQASETARHFDGWIYVIADEDYEKIVGEW